MNSKRRNSRKRARKPKFLSLCRLVTADDESKRRLTEMHSAEKSSKSNHHLNLVEDRENHDHENVAFFFSAADGGGAASLCGLLDGSAAAGSHSSNATNNFSSRAEDLSPSSLTYAYGGESESGAALVKNALRNRERDSSEDKWVCYSEVVERKVTVKEEEVTSSAVDLRPVGIKRLALKLDYQEIMKAWSDKGPLYIDGGENSSQIVPDVNDDFFGNEIWGCNAGLWTVPKMEGDIDHSKGYLRVSNEEALKMVQREASVLRYKEKRQNRLFSKKIRYEVRKLNAQKRPRLKGRFVKRS